VVVDGVLQDPGEQQRPLGCRPLRVVLGELDHRLLDDVERGVLVAHGVRRLLEGAAFHVGEEAFEFWAGAHPARRLRCRTGTCTAGVEHAANPVGRRVWKRARS
jgi:hypothetical protein